MLKLRSAKVKVGAYSVFSAWMSAFAAGLLKMSGKTLVREAACGAWIIGHVMEGVHEEFSLTLRENNCEGDHLIDSGTYHGGFPHS